MGIEENVVVEAVDAAGELGCHVGSEPVLEHRLLIGRHGKAAVDGRQPVPQDVQLGRDLREVGLGAGDDAVVDSVVGHGRDDLRLMVR